MKLFNENSKKEPDQKIIVEASLKYKWDFWNSFHSCKSSQNLLWDFTPLKFAFFIKTKTGSITLNLSIQTTEQNSSKTKYSIRSILPDILLYLYWKKFIAKLFIIFVPKHNLTVLIYEIEFIAHLLNRFIYSKH